MMNSKIDFSYLRKYGYEKYNCKKCEEGVIWSTVPRDTCPDRPCSKYEFLYRDYKRVRPLTLNEVRGKFINFLKSRGHGVVDPYPVLARWRNDLYLTIASIIVFQPAVTEGVVDPPHNPLVIVQPSVRLTDVDEVGFTFGRHLTSFEMGGMHAFNKPGKFVYWLEGIIDNTVEFFNKEIGIDLEDLVFKEGWWEGGGNAGPAPEVLVDGMELATLVHMMYKVVDGKYVEMPILVVDCGYGIERIAWFTQRTPTGFHAIYGDLVKKYADALGVEELPQDLLKKIVYELSDKDVKSPEGLARALRDMGLGEYAGQLINSIYAYALLDHMRTIALMLSDGIVPSNSGEGYLARLLIRRLLRNLIKLGIEPGRLSDIALELADLQVKYWRGDYIYGKFERHRDYIFDVLGVEANKFVDATYRGIEVVEKYIKRKKGITAEDLMEIYDSHGIPPEFVAEKARTAGISVEVPPDIYSKIAAKHSSVAFVKEKEHEFPDEVVKWASHFQPTRRLFHEDPYAVSARAKVLGVMGKHVVLDSTIMYPWAGGQDHDTGYIRAGDRAVPVVYVGKVGDAIVHVLAEELGEGAGAEVEMVIDWERRYRLMRHHTATHVVLAAARKLLGDHVWQAGAEKTVEKARLDITHHKALSEEEVREIEDLANRIVSSRIELNFRMMGKFEAEAEYGLKIYQGGAIYSPVLRIVEIPGWDAQACFGTHLRNTVEIGAIKITKAERIQDGVIRLEFIAGDRLVERIRELEDEKRKSIEVLGGVGEDLLSITRKFAEELRNSQEKLRSYRKIVEELLVERAISASRQACGLSLTAIEIPIEDEKLAKDVLEELSMKRGMVAAIRMGDIIEVAMDPKLAEAAKADLRELIKELAPFGAKGGGKRDHVTYRSKEGIPLEALAKAVEKVLCRQ